MKTSLIVCTTLLFLLSTAVFAGPDELQHFDFDDEEILSSVSMNVLIVSLGGIDYVEGAEIACLTPGDVIGGATALYGDPESRPLPPSWGFAVWGDEPLTEEIVEGFTAGEELRFLYWDPLSDMEFNTGFTIDEGEAVFNENSLLIIDMAVSVDSEELSMPLQFGLSGVYPNPFNSTAVLNYSVAVKENISLLLYDLSGRMVKELKNGIQSPGNYQYSFNGGNIAAGVYIVRLKNGAQTHTQQVILLK